MKLDAFALNIPHARMCPLISGRAQRDWMDDSQSKFAYKCVPLVMANTSILSIPCPFNLRIRWNGLNDINGIEIENLDGEDNYKTSDFFASHFGNGILTFRLPWLFRTYEEGIGVELSGPPNQWIPGMFPLQGLVETWGHASSATMNWRVMYSDTDFYIPKDFPICNIRPFDFRLIDEMEVHPRLYQEIPEDFQKDYREWGRLRDLVLSGAEGSDEARACSSFAYGRNRDAFGNQLPTKHFTPFRITTPATVDQLISQYNVDGTAESNEAKDERTLPEVAPEPSSGCPFHRSRF